MMEVVKCQKSFYEEKVASIKKELTDNINISNFKINGYTKEVALSYISILKKHGVKKSGVSKHGGIGNSIIHEAYYSWIGQSFKQRCNYEIVVRITKSEGSDRYNINFSNKIIFPRNKKGLIDNNIHLYMHCFL